jgi:hypothetical protein
MNRCGVQLFRLERSNEVGTISPRRQCATRTLTPRSGRPDPPPVRALWLVLGDALAELSGCAHLAHPLG